MNSSGLVELEAVLAVARHGGFRAAATALGMSRSALSATVAALEARLGVRLFNRTTRSVATTEAGEQFIARIAPALADIRGAIEAVNELRETPTGTLRLNTSVGAAQMIFAPVVLEYLRRYPAMKVDIVTERRMVDIVAEGFDAGIRLAESVPRDMVSIPLTGEQRMVVVASPQYLQAHPRPQVPDELLAHRCVRWRFSSGTVYRWEFARHGEALTLDVPGPLTLDEPLLMLEAARAGVGIAYLGLFHVAEDLASGRLLPLLEEWSPSYPGICLYYPSRRHMPAGLRAFVELVREVTARPLPEARGSTP
ncbi:MAG: LysR family transcriptional regulator [Burkholderiaceae bacterium]